MSDKYEKIDVETTKLAGAFLFHKEANSEYLDMRTQVKSDKMSEMLLYYSIMGNTYGIDVCMDIKDTVERLLISRLPDTGRRQAVETLKQNFPKRVEIEKGSDQWR
jgi:hypothetical protein